MLTAVGRRAFWAVSLVVSILWSSISRASDGATSPTSSGVRDAEHERQARDAAERDAIRKRAEEPREQPDPIRRSRCPRTARVSLDQPGLAGMTARQILNAVGAGEQRLQFAREPDGMYGAPERFFADVGLGSVEKAGDVVLRFVPSGEPASSCARSATAPAHEVEVPGTLTCVSGTGWC
jgi:hypothetical protein